MSQDGIEVVEVVGSSGFLVKIAGGTIYSLLFLNRFRRRLLDTAKINPAEWAAAGPYNFKQEQAILRTMFATDGKPVRERTFMHPVLADGSLRLTVGDTTHVAPGQPFLSLVLEEAARRINGADYSTIAEVAIRLLAKPTATLIDRLGERMAEKAAA